MKYVDEILSPADGAAGFPLQPKPDLKVRPGIYEAMH